MSVKVSISDCRAGAEPKVFDGEKGSKVARVAIAHNERTNDEPGAVKEETRWFQAVGFGPAARFIEENVHKGTRLEISGAELHYGRAYTGKDNVTRTPDELHIVNSHGATIALKEALGERPDQAEEQKLTA